MKPQFDALRPHFVTMIVAAVLAALVAVALLATVTELFVHDGTPFEHAVLAERACANHAYISEREACARAFRGDSLVSRVASR